MTVSRYERIQSSPSGGSIPPHYPGAYPSLGCCGGPNKLVAVGGSAMAHQTVVDGIMPGGVIDGEALMRAIGGDVGFDDPVDIPAEAPLPPRTIVVPPPDGDEWIERYRETVTHGCQEVFTHPLSMCLDWPCPNTDAAECRMVRERYVAEHRDDSQPYPRCIHHDTVKVHALFTNPLAKPEERKTVTLTLIDETLGMTGGPTGYESISRVDDDVVEQTSVRGWSANAGGGGWDACLVPAAEMVKAWRFLGMPEDRIDTGGREGPERGIE